MRETNEFHSLENPMWAVVLLSWESHVSWKASETAETLANIANHSVFKSIKIALMINTTRHENNEMTKFFLQNQLLYLIQLQY